MQDSKEFGDTAAEIYVHVISPDEQPDFLIGSNNQLNLSSTFMLDLESHKLHQTSRKVRNSADFTLLGSFKTGDEKNRPINTNSNKIIGRLADLKVKGLSAEEQLGLSQDFNSNSKKAKGTGIGKGQCDVEMNPVKAPGTLSALSLKRRVSFADNLGQELTSIRIMTEGRDSPPKLSSQLISISHETQDIEKPSTLYEAKFNQPITNFRKYIHQLSVGNVALDSFGIFGRLFNGSVKVRNIAYEKHVYIRYTTDNWRTYSDYSCNYVKIELVGPEQYIIENIPSVYDTFNFQLEIPADCCALEFCVGYSCAGQIYWDNNSGLNYLLIRLAVN